MNKKLRRMILALTLALTLIGVMAGCIEQQEEEQILLEHNVFKNELGEVFTIPKAVCLTGEKVTFQIFDAEGKEVPIENGGCILEKCGEYKIVCTAGAHTREAALICQDTIGPEIVINFDDNAAIGQMYVLPSAGAKDLSGVDESEILVELYIEGQETPVASGAGESILIEAVEGYVLKVSAKDRAGNVSYAEQKITPIAQNAVVINDFSTEYDAVPNDVYGNGGADASCVYYSEIDGRSGVIALNVNSSVRHFTMWKIASGGIGCFSDFTSITIRMKVVGDIAAGYWGTNGFHTGGAANGIAEYGWPVGEWFEFTLTTEQLGNMFAFNAIYLGCANDSAGNLILIDQIYGTPKE